MTCKTSHLKLEITRVFSIVDRKFGRKGTTTTTSCISWRKVTKQKVRKQVRVRKDTTAQLTKPVGQIASNQVVITLKNEPKGQFRGKTYNQVNWL